jgi:general stress protein YciG
MGKRRQGFACLSLERRKEIASMGGRAALNRHKFTSEEASLAGKLGGRPSHRTKPMPSDYDAYWGKSVG